MTKKIDIMLPYWGDIKLLKETVDSVIGQTSPNWHLTILDDHYVSPEAAEYFETLSHPQITYIRHEKNIGITNNFNFALHAAKEEFCCIVGCDDRLLPNYVERALQLIGTADAYQPCVEVIDAKGMVYLPLADKVKQVLRPKRIGYYSNQSLATSLCVGNWLYFPSIVWRTSSLQQYTFEATYTIVQDVALELSLILDGGVFYVDSMAVPSFQYRRFSESLSSKEKTKNGRRFREEAMIYQSFASKFREHGWHRAALVSSLRLTSRLNKLLS